MGITEKHTQLARFWKKFLRLTRGRVPVLRALRVISVEETDPEFKKVVDSIRKSIDKGKTLSEALQDHQAEFSPSIRELVRTAEQSGAWDEILEEIADGLQEGTFC